MDKGKTYIAFGKKLLLTGGAQAIVQGTGLLCGLIIIRLLPTQEFALYTLANTMLGTMTLLSDGGIAIGVMSLGGQCWQDPQKLGSILHTGLSLRQKFAIVSLLITVPILYYLLNKHGSSVLSSVLIILSLIPAFWASLSDSLLEIPLRLHQDIYALQQNQILVNVGRLLLSGVFVFLFPFTLIAMFGNSIPRIVGNMRLRKMNTKYLNSHSATNAEYQKHILDIVKRTLPNTVYYCLSGQIAIWIISIFGKTNAVAQLGALSRLTMILAVFNSVVSILYIPNYAKLPNDKSVLTKRFLGIQVIVWSICAGIMLLVYCFPNLFLLLLGRQYADLQKPLFLSMLGACITFIVGSSYSVYSSRGMVMNPIRSIGVSILAIVVSVLCFDVSNIMGVLYMNIMIGIFEWINHSAYYFSKVGK